MIKKIFYFLLLTFSTHNFANQYDSFGFVSGEYIGTCYGLEHLRKTKCSSITWYIPELCINAVLDLTPHTLKSEFKKDLENFHMQFLTNTRIGVDKAFKKTDDLTGGDITKSCLVYSSTLITKNYQLFEELKRIRSSFK